MDAQRPGGTRGRAPSDVDEAARAFAAALAATPVFKAFEEASERFGEDERATDAYRSFQAQQRALQPYMVMGVATDDQRVELDRLHEAFVSQPSAARLLEAQEALVQVCVAIDSLLSVHTGLGYASTCSPRCCG